MISPPPSLMTNAQRVAMQCPCLLAFECAHPRYVFFPPDGKVRIVLTINAGYECLEEGWEAPIWHASVAPTPGQSVSEKVLHAHALHALEGVGNWRQEWHEWTGSAYHIRRQVRVQEQQQIGAVRDIRGTPEADERYNHMASMLDPTMRLLEKAEIGFIPSREETQPSL